MKGIGEEITNELAEQSTLEGNPEYFDFMEKFKPKKTTDDCYTPEPVYDAILDWVRRRYAIPADAPIIRPFYPGGDYTRERYPEDCVVVDNPPFSIVTKICRFYNAHGIKFFLFAPGLTLFQNDPPEKVQYVFVETDIIYANGANVNTCFKTNMSDCFIECAVDLDEALFKAQKKEPKEPLPKYDYPPAIGTSSRFQTLVRHGIPFKVRKGLVVSRLDAMRKDKACFGKAVMLTTEDEKRLTEARAEAERKRAEWQQSRLNAPVSTKGAVLVFEMSDRERKMQQMLEGKRVQL